MIFTGINFYARDFHMSDAEYDAFIAAGRAAGLGVYMDHGEGQLFEAIVAVTKM